MLKWPDMPELTWNGYFWQTKKNIPFLGYEANIIFITGSEDTHPDEKQVKIPEELDTVPRDFMSAVDDAAEEYRKNVMDSLTEEDKAPLKPINRKNISQHYRINEIVIPELGESKEVLFFLTGDCDWEPEHGIEILVQNRKVVSCGIQDALYLNEEWKRYIS